MPKLSQIPRLAAAALALASLILVARAAARADEFVLKDGRKINGTIVGFENGMFRVETDYGYVLIRKDMVDSVKVAPGEQKAPAAATEKSKAPTSPATARAPAAAPAPPPPAAPARAQTQTANPPLVSASLPRAPAPATAAKPVPPPSHPLDVPLPAQLEQHVDGNTYFSDTFHFSMYKPPDWKLVAELPKGKMSPIVVMSSEDEQSLLVVDRQVWSGVPDLRNDAVEANLRESYEDYRKLSEQDIQLDGEPAVRRVFSGVMDGVEWHGVAVRVVDGTTIFGIIGLTSADQYQFYESLLAKMIHSFHLSARAAVSAAAAQKPTAN